MEQISRNPLRLLGGNYTLNWRNHALFAIPAFVSAASFDYERLGGDPALWLMVAAIGFSVTVFVIESLRPLVTRFQSVFARALLASLVLLFAGFVRGLTIFLVGNAVEIIPEQDLFFRLLGGPIFVLSVYILTSSILEGYLNYRKQLGSLTQELVRLERSRTTYAQDLQRVNREQRARVRELLAAPMWELQKKLKSAKDPSGLQDALLSMQAINNDVVRPLSHELGTTTIRVRDNFDSGQNLPLSAVLPERIRLKKVQSLPLLLTVILSVGLNAQIGTSTPLQGLTVVLSATALIVPFFWLEQNTYGLLKLPRVLATILSLGSGFLSGAVAGYIVTYLGLSATENFWWQAGIYLVITKLIVLSFGIFDLSWRKTIAARSEVAEELKRLNSRLRQQLWLGQKSLAMELHGSVQGTLHALASRLSKMKQPDLKEIDEILSLIRESLRRIEKEDYLAGGNLLTLLDDLRDLWEGTVEISWNMSEAADRLLDEDLGLARCVFEVIREAVTNSVKHGDATAVDINLSLDRELVLQVTNNGTPAKSFTGYAGEELFDQLCLSHEIENSGSGVVLRARLALSPEAEQLSLP